MPEAQTTPRTKRAVSVRAPRRARVVVEPKGEQGDTGINYALRMTEALDAISSAQIAPPREEPIRGQRAGFGPPKPTRPSPQKGTSPPDWLSRLKKLPPIRLPIGPPIPWRLGLPVLVVLIVVTVFVARPAANAGSPVSRLPTPATYPVQQEAPLFTDAQPSPTPVPVSQPIGIPDAGGVGFDVVDVGIKLIAVLALAYGSLLLLKRTGMGGAARLHLGGREGAGLQVVASVTLAPNRTVHLLKVPGGKTVLVGATPNQVNLIVDLGEIAEDLESDPVGSFFDVLKGKIAP